MEGLFPFAYHHRPPNYTIFRIQETTAQIENPDAAGKNNPCSVNPVQLAVKFVYRKHYKVTKRTTRSSANDDNTETETTVMEIDKTVKQRSCQFDMDKLKNYADGDAFGILSGVLGTIGIFHGHGAEERKRYVVRRTMEAGLVIGNKVSNMGRKVLGLRVDVITEYGFVYCDFHTRILRSRMQDEVINRSIADATTGMVPASDASIAMALKRVPVGGGDEDDREEAPAKKTRTITMISESDSCSAKVGLLSERCTVCLEELINKGGSEVASMPCGHVFHEECIVTWLKQSHYCPLCRFQVSID